MVYTGCLLPFLSHVLLKVPNSYLVHDDFHLLVFKLSWLNVFSLTCHFFKRNIKIVCRGAISLLLIVHWFISPRELLVFFQITRDQTLPPYYIQITQDQELPPNIQLFSSLCFMYSQLFVLFLLSVSLFSVGMQILHPDAK